VPPAEARTLELWARTSCVLVDGGDVRCWGLNDFGQFGDGTAANQPAPVPVV
jgi:hypothetical protein